MALIHKRFATPGLDPTERIQRLISKWPYIHNTINVSHVACDWVFCDMLGTDLFLSLSSTHNCFDGYCLYMENVFYCYVKRVWYLKYCHLQRHVGSYTFVKLSYYSIKRNLEPFGTLFFLCFADRASQYNLSKR